MFSKPFKDWIVVQMGMIITLIIIGLVNIMESFSWKLTFVNEVRDNLLSVGLFIFVSFFAAIFLAASRIIGMIYTHTNIDKALYVIAAEMYGLASSLGVVLLLWQPIHWEIWCIFFLIGVLGFICFYLTNLYRENPEPANLDRDSVVSVLISLPMIVMYSAGLFIVTRI